MPFAFLAPAFLVGLAALVVPVLIHLIQRERKEVVAFPSLMFLRRIPYQSVERRRIHNWLLLALRAAAMACLVAAFSRPFLKQSLAAAAAPTGAREVVILLDVSASMGYGDHWAHATDAAHKVVATLGAEDKCTLVLFSRNAEENVRATSDRGRLDAAIADAKVGSDSTRFAPALRLAQSLLSRSSLPRREAVLISDFQKTGWERHEEIHLPEGATMTPVSVATDGLSDLSVSSVAFTRDTFSGEERVKVTAGLTNRGSTPYTNVAATLDVDGRRIDSRPTTIAPNASESVTFLPFTVSETSMRGVVHAGTDALPSDNAYYFALSPSRPLSVLIIQADGANTSSVYLTTALGIGSAPPFKTDVVLQSRVTPSTLEHRTVVILHDVTPLSSATDDLLKRFVQQGGGLWVALGEHTPWAGGQSPLLPGTTGPAVDRTSGVGGMLGFLDYSHQVLELFKDPRGGNFADAHFLRYRTLTPGPTDRVLARFDDGGVAMAERDFGSGRVIAWTSPLDDSWSVDFPKAKLFLPLVHEVVTYLAQYTAPTTSYTVGHLLDVSVPIAAIVREGTAGDTQSAAARKATGLVVSPSGQQTTIGEGGAPSVELAEQGFYTVRMQGTADTRPFVAAVNLDPAESDLAPLEPTSFVASVTGQSAVTVAGQSLEHPDLTPADVEKKQYVWWFLLVAGALALLGEAVLANRASGRFGIGLLQVRRG
jgi:hypothetical protein